MRKSWTVVLAFNAVLLLSGFVARAGSIQGSSTMLCDGIAKQIRGLQDLTSGRTPDDPLKALSTGEHPYVELAGASDPDLPTGDAKDFTNRFLAKFNPSDELAKAAREFIGDGNYGPNGYLEMPVLPGSEVHLLASYGGTASCASFLFFQSAKGRQSQLLPSLPPEGDNDGDNLICSGYHTDGYLVRLNGTDVFLEFHSGETDYKYSLRVVPLQAGRWGSACKVEAGFRPVYSVAKVLTPKDGVLPAEILRGMAAQIVERHDAARDPKDFNYGPPVPEREKEKVRTMAALAAKLDNPPVPAFGSDNELGNGEGAIQDADTYPLVIGTDAYLIRMGHAAIGWRIFTNSIVVVYTLKDGKLEPVATAIVAQSQGAMDSLRVSPSR